MIQKKGIISYTFLPHIARIHTSPHLCVFIHPILTLPLSFMWIVSASISIWGNGETAKRMILCTRGMGNEHSLLLGCMIMLCILVYTLCTLDRLKRNIWEHDTMEVRYADKNRVQSKKGKTSDNFKGMGWISEWRRPDQVAYVDWLLANVYYTLLLLNRWYYI